MKREVKRAQSLLTFATKPANSSPSPPFVFAIAPSIPIANSINLSPLWTRYKAISQSSKREMARVKILSNGLACRFVFGFVVVEGGGVCRLIRDSMVGRIVDLICVREDEVGVGDCVNVV